MLAVKKICWPTDFSECSKEALLLASEIASHFSAELYVIHVVPKPDDFTVPLHPTKYVISGSMEKMKEQSEKAIKDLLAEKVQGGMPLHTIVKVGNAAHEILHFLEERGDIDLLVISTHGRTGLRRFALGSVTEKIIRHASCPVLVVKSFKRENPKS